MRLELSSEGRYALRALMYLAWLGERATADRISAEAHVHAACWPASLQTSPALVWSRASRDEAEDPVSLARPGR